MQLDIDKPVVGGGAILERGVQGEGRGTEGVGDFCRGKGYRYFLISHVLSDVCVERMWESRDKMNMYM